MNIGKLLIFIIKKRKISQQMGCVSIWKMFVLCIWLIDLTVGELKSSQVRQSGKHDIEFSANPDMVCADPESGTVK